MGIMTNYRVFPAAAALAILCGQCFAAVEVSKIRWQVPARQSVAHGEKFADASELLFSTDSAKPPRFAVAAGLVNNGARSAEASIVRCAFSFRLIKLSDPAKPGVWAVPFMTEERRISKIKPGMAFEIKIRNVDIKPFLSRLRASGYWPDAVKVQLMVEPRPGDELTVTEAVIPVNYR